MDKRLFLIEKTINITGSIPHSRIHRLNTFNSPDAICMAKRDDELGFGISGSKRRKYLSLIPYLLQNNYQEAVVIGSAYSNHVLGLSQLLIENRIKPILFLLGDPKSKPQGNLLLTSLLVPEAQMRWISRKDWPEVEARAAEYVQSNPIPTSVIPEGASMDAALPGALTLALDILREEHQFDHIFMDAGTGLSSIATILAFAWLNKLTLIHVVLLAGDEEQFLTALKRFHQSFEFFIEDRLSWAEVLKRFRLHRPKLARAFGSVNTAIVNHIKFLAREEGFFTDPIYSAKLFYEAKDIILTEKLRESILVVHSGGALTLMGFQKEILKI